MNPAVFSSLPADACVPGSTGPHGPDRIAKNIYDAAGQVIQVIEAFGTADSRTYATYTYSDNGQLIDSIDAKGNRTRAAYDGFDRHSATFFPLSNGPAAFNPSTYASALATAGSHNPSDFELFGYDNNGNTISFTRRDGNVIGFTFDQLDRQVFKDMPGGTATDVHTRYDLSNNTIHSRFVSSTGPGVTFTHDLLGRVKSSTDMNGRTVSYDYNAGSARTRLTFPDGNYIGYARDDGNRISSAGWNANSGLYSQTFNNLGEISTVTKGASVTTHTYDAFGRFATLKHDLAGTANDVTWTFIDYNAVGQLMAREASSPVYDFQETAASAQAKGFDGLNRFADFAAQPGGYDARGNLKSDGTRVFTFDLENRLLSSTGGSAPLELTYDPLGRLAGYSSGGSQISFLYDGVNVIAEYDVSGLLRRYVHGTSDDDPIVWLEGAGAANVRYFFSNMQNSVIASADASGSLINAQKYGPYGEPKDANNAESWPGTRFRFTGQIALPEAKLYYFKARVYDPLLGRFLQTDPVGDQDDSNLYAYVSGDPVNSFDPTGLYECEQHGSYKVCEGTNKEMDDMMEEMKGFQITSATQGFYGAGLVTDVYALIWLPPQGGGKLANKGLAGHSGVGVGDEYWDIGPGAGIWWSPAVPWYDKPFNCEGDACDLKLKDIMDNNVGNEKFHVFKRIATAEQANVVRRYWQHQYAEPGHYSLLMKQCTTTVSGSLARAGLGIHRVLKPISLYRQAARNWQNVTPGTFRSGPN